MQYHEVMHEIGFWNGGLLMEEIAPSSNLSKFIKSYQLLTGQNEVKYRHPWYILPDHSAHLIFYLFEKGGQFHPSLRLVGPRTAHRLTDRASRHLTLIATFKPGAIGYFCPPPIKELTDVAVDAKEVLCGVDDHLLEGLKEAAQQRAITRLIALIEQMLLSQLKMSKEATRFLHHFGQIDLHPLIKVSDIAGQMGISTRYLRTLTHKYIGHAPKDILQISRFTRSLVMSNQHREWPAIAVDAGFYDQSHMIATYQKMCGTSPERLFNS